jgi:MSHA biogenesis protein MshP
MTYTKQSQRGFVLVAAIFLLVVLAALGAFMVSFSNTQHLTSAQDVQGSRAYWAARAGVEWAVSRINTSSGCTNPPTSINGFTLAIACPSQAYAEGGSTKTVFAITSVASTGGGVGSLGYIERSLSATVEF